MAFATLRSLHAIIGDALDDIDDDDVLVYDIEQLFSTDESSELDVQTRNTHPDAVLAHAAVWAALAHGGGSSVANAHSDGDDPPARRGPSDQSEPERGELRDGACLSARTSSLLSALPHYARADLE